MKKGILIILLFVLAVSSTLALTGTGTEDEPYEITNLADLNYLSETNTIWDRHFSQTANIDASSTSSLNDGAGFSPIGNSVTKFTGSYDGQGFTISNLKINRPNTDYIGLFGYTNGATISNLGLLDNEIIGQYNTGSLVGSATSSTISNSYASGAVSGTSYVGGFIGFAPSSTISNSYASGTVSGTSHSVAGFLGVASSSTISNSYASGSVSGTSYLGGFLGQASSSTISNSYASGAVSGSQQVGGLVGYRSGGSVTNSFWDINTTGQTASNGGTGKTTAQMQDINTYLNAGWDFDAVWLLSLNINSGYPFFNNCIRNVSVPFNALNISLTPTISFELVEEFIAYELYFGDNPNPGTALIAFSPVDNPISYTFTQQLEYLTNYYWTLILYDADYNPTTLNFTFKTRPSFVGLGTQEDPYQIATINDLIDISENSEFCNKYLIQTADIDASLTSTLNAGAGFSPIGNNDVRFTGSYDGQGFTISNLKINRPSTDYIALFGSTNGATISNLGLVENEIIGYQCVGGLVGYAYSSSISNSYAGGTVSGTLYHVGGFIGIASSSTISNSYASGAINGWYDTGGFIGWADSSTINNSYASGSVSGNSEVGGFIGEAYSSSIISNSYASGSVSGNSEVGGFIGEASYSSIIRNSYARGAVSGTERVGGLVGYGSVTATNSFWDIETSGQTTSAGGRGKTSQAMTSLYTYLNAGWDFLGEEVNGSQDIWHIHPSVNSGYPYLVSDQEDVASYIPTYALASYPHTGGSNLATSDNLVWQADFLELTSGYRLNLGTDNPPTNLVNNQDLGLVTFYDYNNLEANTTYYWQIIPYNANGDAEDCSIWSFTTGTTGLVSVGSGDNTNQALPINQQIQKSYSQSIYLQSELNLANRDIESLAFYLTGDFITSGANQWKVYLGHTTKTEFASANDWLLANQGLTEVANLTLSGTISAGWVEFQLSAPFAYNNVDNLIVGVVEYSSGIAENPVNFYTVETNSNRSLSYGHTSATPNPNIPYAGTISTSIPKINFTFSESTTRFTGLVQNSQNQVLTNANVYIAEFGTFPTNALGEFNIHNVQAGTYQVAISAPWYETKSLEFDVLEGQDNYLEITLLEELLPANNPLATLAPDLSSVAISWSAPALSRGLNTSKEEIQKATKQTERIVGPTVAYNLYRYESADADVQENWLEVATNLTALTYTDSSFPTLELGNYYWAVSVVYVNDRISVPALSNEVAKQAFLESSLEELNFGVVYLTNQSAYSEIILTNTGSGDLIISSISCDEPAFNLLYDEGAFVLTPNASFTIEVNFNPSSPLPYLAQLLINNNSSNEANFEITLRGLCEYLPPLNPEGVQVTMIGNAAHISWEAVTEDVNNNPITPDYYIVYFNGQNTTEANDYYFLDISTVLYHNHNNVGLFSPFQFYRVKAYIDIDNEVVSQLNQLVTQKGKMTQKEVEELIRNSKLKGLHKN